MTNIYESEKKHFLRVTFNKLIFDIFIVRCLGGYFFPDSVELRIGPINQ